MNVLKSFLALLFAVGLSACLKQIPFPESDTPKLVLGGLFWTDTTWAFSLAGSETLATNGAIVTPVYDAACSLTMPDGSQVSMSLNPERFLRFFNPGQGLDSLLMYTLDTPLPQPGELYAIEVRAPGFPPIYAEDRIPKRVSNLSYEWGRPRVTPDDPTQEYSFSRGFPSELDLRLRFKDEAKEANYYQVLIDRKVLTIDPSSGDSTHQWLRVNYLTDELGSLRLFARQHSSYLFDDLQFDGEEKELLITLRLQIPVNELSGAKLRVQFLSLSHNYYQTLASYQRSVGAMDAGVLEEVNEFFQEPVSTYTNVEGGFGVFAGASRVEQVLVLP